MQSKMDILVQKIEQKCHDDIQFRMGCWACYGDQYAFNNYKYQYSYEHLSSVLDPTYQYILNYYVLILVYISSALILIYYFYLRFSRSDIPTSYKHSIILKDSGQKQPNRSKLDKILNKTIFVYLDHYEDPIITPTNSQYRIIQYLDRQYRRFLGWRFNVFYRSGIAKEIYFHLIYLGFIFRIPLSMLITIVILSTSELSLAIYFILKCFCDMVSITGLVFVVSLIASKRELLRISQNDHKQQRKKRIAQIVYYHIGKGLQNGLIYCVFKVLIYWCYNGGLVQHEVWLEEYSTNMICQADNILYIMLIMSVVSFNYNKSDVSINQNERKMVQWKKKILLQKYSNQLLNNLFTDTNLSAIVQKSSSQQQNCPQQQVDINLVQQRLDYQLDVIGLQLDSDIEVVQDEKFKTLQKNRDGTQPNQFLYLIMIFMVHIMKVAVIIGQIVISLNLSQKGDKCYRCMQVWINMLLQTRMVIMVLEYFLLDICILLCWLKKDAIIEKKSLFQQAEKKGRQQRSHSINMNI